VNVTGATPANMDFTSYLGARILGFFGVVLALSFLLLMAVFQWGWFGTLIGVGKGGPIEAFIPMMLFAIVFGLSMDYEVFLLSRMREEYDRTSDNASAVADGLAATARVITSAAAIMVFVFGSFLLEDLRQIKLFGLGLAIAVFIDATVVRMILVPATMELLGNRNWWLPGWIARILPKIDVEGSHPGPAHQGAASDSAAPDEDDVRRGGEPVGAGRSGGAP
jgi:RND superfamily putative drug exporter